MRRSTPLTAALCAGSLLLAPAASADPDSGRIRMLDCGAAGKLETVLTPNAFFVPAVPAFHVVGSNAVIVPLAVRVNGTPIKRQPATSQAANVDCSYIDPAGNLVEISGRLTPG
jgi:hypothetical protein